MEVSSNILGYKYDIVDVHSIPNVCALCGIPLADSEVFVCTLHAAQVSFKKNEENNVYTLRISENASNCAEAPLFCSLSLWSISYYF